MSSTHTLDLDGLDDLFELDSVELGSVDEIVPSAPPVPSAPDSTTIPEAPKSVASKSEVSSLLKVDDDGEATGVDVVGAYNELEELITLSKSIMHEAYYLIKTSSGDMEVFKTANDVIKTITQLLKQFTKVNSEELAHRRKIEIEEVKFQNKVRLMEAESALHIKKMQETSIPADTPENGNIEPAPDVVIEPTMITASPANMLDDINS